MRLGQDEVLFLEGAEDFDIHSADGVIATQVKDTAGSGTLTLRSSDAVAAINNLWRHQRNNPGKKVSLRFLTTALPGRERGGEFGDITSGIEYWSSAKRDNELSLEPLKVLLLSVALEASLAEFLRTADDQAIRKNFICCIDWDTGSKPIDGLVADIKDRLVFFGASIGIDSYQSEKVLDRLLRRIADLLSSDNERRLSYADFVREFERATMELVSREEAVTLRAAAAQFAQFAPLANNSILTDLNIAARVLGAPLRVMEGAAPRADLVNDFAGVLRRHGVLFLRGSTGLGKTSVAQLLVNEIGDEWVWAGFRGRDPRQVADHLKRAALEIKAYRPPPRVVLDDLDLGSIAQFERELLSLVFSIANQGGAVMVTGPTACPSGLLAKLWLPSDCDREVTYFDEGDVRDVLVSHGLADPTKLEQWSRLTWLFTAGHPQLVHARVRNLQSNGWPLTASDFLKTEDLEQVRGTARRRLIDELPSEGARYIGYRLSLITSEFSRQTAFDLAQLPPPVALPGEAFDGLVGPWIEIVRNDCYRVSPLLSNAGNRALSEPEQTAVHTSLAFGILKRRTMTPHEFGTALMHAFLAKSERALILLAKVALALDHGALRAISDVVFWFPAMALEPGQQISTNIAIATFLRLAQFRIAVAGRETDKALLVIDRSLELLEQMDHQKLAQMNEVMAYTLFLSTIDIPIPPRRSISMLARLMELGESDEHFAKIAQNFRRIDFHTIGDFSEFSPFQMLFSLEVARISGIDALSELLDALDGLNAEKRQPLIEVLEKNTGKFARLLVSTSWWKDVSKNTLDIGKALTTLRKAIDLGKVWSSLSLVRASYIAISVLNDEYNNAPESALAVLEEAATDFGATDVHILNQHAKVVFRQGRDEEAVRLFNQALMGDSLDPVERVFASRNGGMAAASSGNWHAVEQLFLGGASAVEAFPGFKSLAAGLKADAAFARWKQSRHADALRLYAEVLELLEDIPIDENSQTRHIHAAVRHCVGWLVISTTGGSDRDATEPAPGICSNPEPIVDLEDRSLIGMAAVWGALGYIDARLGTGLGLLNLAEQKSDGALPPHVRCWERIDRYQELWNGTNLPRAVPIVIGMIEASVCLKELNAAQRDGWAPGNIMPLPGDYWEDQNNRAYLLFTLLALGVLATCLHPASPLPVESWMNDAHLRNITGPEIERFFPLVTRGKNQTDGSLLEEAALALCRIREETLLPNDLFRCHFRLLNALCSAEWGKYAGDALAKIVASQWMNACENQCFALTSPSLFAPLLKEKCADISQCGFSKVASLLKAAAVAAGVSLADSGIDFLTQLERGEESSPSTA